MRTPPARRRSRKRRLQSATAPSICDRRPGPSRARITYASSPVTAALGPACDHLLDRGLALGPPRADRGTRSGGDSAPRLQALALRTRRRAVAIDDADRLHRAGDPALSAQADRGVAAHARILAECGLNYPVREIRRRRPHCLPLRRDAAEAVGDGLVRKALRIRP